MSTLEYTIYEIRRSWQVSRTFIFAGAFAAAIVVGLFDNLVGGEGHKIAAIVLFGMWAAVFGFRARRHFFGNTKPAAAGRVELELGLLLVLVTHAAVQVAGGLASPIYPMIFVLVAFLVVYTRQWVGFTLVAATIGVEFSIVSINSDQGELSKVVFHSVFIVMFSLINLVFTRTEVARARRRAVRRLEEAQNALAADARDFRLTSATSDRMTASTRKEEESRLSRCTVSEVRRSMYHHIDLLKQTMGLHSCILYWFRSDKQWLRILECVSDGNIKTKDLKKTEGVIGAVIQSGCPMTLKDLRFNYPGIPYYDGDFKVTDFLGVPVKEGSDIRGVLCADRINGERFSPKEQNILTAAVDSILQNVSNERIFAQLQRAKSEQGKLLRASEALSQALNEKDVVDAALDAASQIAHFDMAAVALIRKKGKQEILKVRGTDLEGLEGVIVGSNTGLAASVVKNKHYLPYRGEFDPKQQVVYNKSLQKLFLDKRSLMVLPLIAAEEVLGTLTLATKQPSAFTTEIRTTLQVMINQLGTSLQNAEMVRRLEDLATTDGLTSLPNHRMFQEELTRQLAQSNRFGSETSIILCDLDKFKNVNDTFGHPVGDIVLKALGETLRRNVVRDTDMPARYGGEEFIIICGGTGTDGAVKLGNKIRQDLENQLFRTDKGELRCTISMGVATFPQHAKSKETLIERADQALYVAKENGRNQVCVWKKGY